MAFTLLRFVVEIKELNLCTPQSVFAVKVSRRKAFCTGWCCGAFFLTPGHLQKTPFGAAGRATELVPGSCHLLSCSQRRREPVQQRWPVQSWPLRALCCDSREWNTVCLGMWGFIPMSCNSFSVSLMFQWEFHIWKMITHSSVAKAIYWTLITNYHLLKRQFLHMHTHICIYN